MLSLTEMPMIWIILAVLLSSLLLLLVEVVVSKKAATLLEGVVSVYVITLLLLLLSRFIYWKYSTQYNKKKLFKSLLKQKLWLYRIKFSAVYDELSPAFVLYERTGLFPF